MDHGFLAHCATLGVSSKAVRHPQDQEVWHPRSLLRRTLGGGILLACLMVRSPYSVQPGFSPVSFLFEQATMGRSFYRLDPILSVAITCLGVVSGALGLYVCGILVKRIVGLPDVRPAVVLIGMACLCAIQWSLTPGSPLWGWEAMWKAGAFGFSLGELRWGFFDGKEDASWLSAECFWGCFCSL